MAGTARRTATLLFLAATPLPAQGVRLCDNVSPAGAAPLANAWNALRAALASADSARRLGAELLAVRRFARVLNRAGEVTLERAAGESADSALAVIPMLLADDLARTHCIALVAGSGDKQGLTGLQFRPASREQRALDVVAWTELGELRLLEFRRDAPPFSRDHPQRGVLTFTRMADGAWIVSDWSLHTPVRTERGYVLAYREEGGEALPVSPRMLATADSLLNARKPPGDIAGTVFDSLALAPLARATVRLDSLGPRAHTDTSGAFRFARVGAGRHELRVEHAMFDSIGVPAPGRAVYVVPDSTVRVLLAGPSLATLKGGVCDDSMSVVTGMVRDAATGRALDSAIVTLSWIGVSLGREKLQVVPAEITVPADSAGRYAACVPPRLEITAWAVRGPARSGRVDVRAEERGLAILDLALDAGAADTLAGTAVIRGVVRYQDGTPIPNATVTLTDPERGGTSDAAGVFVFANIPGGTRVVDARAPGHAPARAIVTARPGDTTRTSVYLRRVTTLDAVIVRARAGAGDREARRVAEIEERRRRGQGYRLTPAELLGFKNSNMDAVMRALPFTAVRVNRGETQVTLAGLAGRRCAPSVYLDGAASSMDELSMFSAREVLAVEIFTREIQVPLRYRGNGACGAILVWTR